VDKTVRFSADDNGRDSDLLTTQTQQQAENSNFSTDFFYSAPAFFRSNSSGTAQDGLCKTPRLACCA
jgi:hypothetical protein